MKADFWTVRRNSATSNRGTYWPAWGHFRGPWHKRVVAGDLACANRNGSL